eukprot:TRINITY_DN7395_c0_g1_i1.p1 TRINITY_DN7395_c0_g1~~TRINITY_DN7395_c0_g1_i1.p1  ORF type:complete len:496 (+),score=53.26 TRINITY_DN7395_c0_g1_i1:136-1623(+)
MWSYTILNIKMEALPVINGFLYRKDNTNGEYKQCFCNLIKGYFIGYQDFFHRKIIFSFPIMFAKLETTSEIRDFSWIVKTKNEEEYFYAEKAEDYDKWMKILKKYCFMTNFAKNYEVVRDITQHTLKAQIKLVRSKTTNSRFVAKVYSKSQSIKQRHMMDFIKNEIRIMTSLDSDKLIRLYEFYSEADEIILVLEYARGGTLLVRLTKKLQYKEQEAVLLFRNVLESLKELHEFNVLHRDIKLENIFMPSRSQDVLAKLGDFDISCHTYNIEDNILCGTPGYVAPELFNDKQYSTKSDVYSLGVVLYAIINGKFPFKLKEAKLLYSSNKSCPLILESPNMKNVSSELVAVIKSMLKPNPEDRPSVDELLECPWLRKFQNNSFTIDSYRDFDPSVLEEDDEENYLRSKEKNMVIANKTEDFVKKKTTMRADTLKPEKINATRTITGELCGVTPGYIEVRSGTVHSQPKGGGAEAKKVQLVTYTKARAKYGNETNFS